MSENTDYLIYFVHWIFCLNIFKLNLKTQHHQLFPCHRRQDGDADSQHFLSGVELSGVWS